MTETLTAPAAPHLPLTRALTFPYAASLGSAALLALAASGGLLYPATFYPTEELRQSFATNDLVNLFLGLPILLGSMWLARRGRLLGLLFWPGALFFISYNAAAYAFALPFELAFVLNLLLLTLSVYSMGVLVAAVDATAVQRRLQGVVHERLAGGVLFGLGLAFLLFALGMFAAALNGQAPLTVTEWATHAADIMIAPAAMAGGLLLWRRQALGYVIGLGLLFQTSMLFIGLIAFFILAPLLTPQALQLDDLVVTTVMGLICFVPFVLFARGVWKSAAA